eukprot:gene10250-2669_t
MSDYSDDEEEKPKSCMGRCCYNLICCCFKCCCPPNRDGKYESEHSGEESAGEGWPNFSKNVDKNIDGRKGERTVIQHSHNLTRVRKSRRWIGCFIDSPCFIFFLSFIFVGFGIGIYGFNSGNIERIYLPTDYTGRYCGADNRDRPVGTILFPGNQDCINSQASTYNQTAILLCSAAVQVARVDLTDQKYLWFMDIIDGSFIYGGVCVSYCPGAGNTAQSFCPPELNSTVFLQQNLVDPKYFTYCSYIRQDRPNITFPRGQIDTILESSFTYKPILQRCIPTFKYGNLSQVPGVSVAQSVLGDALTVGTNIWSDVIKNWAVLVLAIPAALVLSYLYLVFLRFFAGLVIWTSLAILFFALEALGGFFIWQGYTTWQENIALELSVVMPQVFFYSGIVICCIGVAYLGLVVLLVLRVRKAIGIIQEASRAIGSMPEIGTVPFFVAATLVLYATYWVTAALYLWTNGNAEIQEFTVRYALSIQGQILFYMHIFSFLWVSQWLFSFSTVVIAGSIGSWYWRRDKRMFDPRAYYVLHSLKRTLFYSLGTISFGSFIVAVIQMIRILFEKAYSELKKGMMENKIAKYVVWAVRIFLWVFEMVVKFINKHAYVQHALYGTPFIKSAGNAFTILTRNFLQVGVLQTLTTISVLMGKILVSVLVAGCGWGVSYAGWFQITNSTRSSSQSPIAIALLCFILAFLVASVFLSIVDAAIDTILQCFLMDDEMCYNDPDRKPYCTKNLSRFIEEHRFLSKLDKLVCQCCCCCKSCQTGAGEIDPGEHMMGGG